MKFCCRYCTKHINSCAETVSKVTDLLMSGCSTIKWPSEGNRKNGQQFIILANELDPSQIVHNHESFC